MDGLIVVSFGLLVVAMWIGIARRQSRARTNKLEVIAQQFGYRFDRAASKVDIIPNHNSFRLFRTSGGRILNRMSVHANNDSLIFDYRFTQRSGQHSRWVYQTVVYFSNVTPLPCFVMRPENVFHKIGSTFGYQDIDFANHARFSSIYILRGEDEEAIRGLFKAYVLDFFARRISVSVECNGTHMIVYEARKRRQPEDVVGYYRQCKEMHRVFNS